MKFGKYDAMKMYRILHVPTGMYFCPSRTIKVRLPDDSTIYQKIGRQIKSNLSKEGKVYTQKPSLKQIGSHYYTHDGISSVTDLTNDIVGEYRMLPVIENEWTIEEVA